MDREIRHDPPHDPIPAPHVRAPAPQARNCGAWAPGRAEFEANVRAQYGDAWMEEHKQLFDDQWAYIMSL